MNRSRGIPREPRLLIQLRRSLRYLHHLFYEPCQKIERVEEELRSLSGVVDGARADIDVIRRDIGWLVGSVSQILENDGVNHHRPNGTFVRGMRRYSRLPTRRVRPRMDEASTLGTHSAEVTDDLPPKP